MDETCCRCGTTFGLYFDLNAGGWFCRNARECSLRIKRRRRNAAVTR